MQGQIARAEHERDRDECRDRRHVEHYGHLQGTMSPAGCAAEKVGDPDEPRREQGEQDGHSQPPSMRPSATAPRPKATLTSTFASAAARRPSSARLWVSSIQVENVV